MTPGLPELPSPFEVIRVPRQRCPHRLPEPEPGALSDCPLVRAMAPTPANDLYWVDPAYTALVCDMAEFMTDHPADPAVFFWESLSLPLRTLQPKLLLTNTVPLVVANYGQRNFQDLIALSRMPRTRSLVLVGYPRIVGSIDVTPKSVVEYEPRELRRLSAAFLFDWIKKVTCHEQVHANHLP